MKPPQCRYKKEQTEMELGKWEEGDLGFEDHGIFTIFGGFDYLDAGHQGMGWCIDLEFIEKFIRVFDTYTFNKCNNKLAWVEHTHGRIYRIISIDGKHEFDIQKWSDSFKDKIYHCKNCDAVLGEDEGTICKKCIDDAFEKVYKKKEVK